MGHKPGVDIEGPASIAGQQLEVTNQVDDEEKDEENSGQAHDDLLSQGGGKKTG